MPKRRSQPTTARLTSRELGTDGELLDLLIVRIGNIPDVKWVSNLARL